VIQDFIPNGAILTWSVVLSCSRFENTRWIEARQDGLRGSSWVAGLIIDGAGIFGFVAIVTVAALSLYDFGWRKTLGLGLLATIAGFVWSAAGILAERGVGRFALWALGTLLLYVSAIVLFCHFTWFGVFGRH
jgi:hypothetical protein